ncbi:MAG: benzoate transporter [Micromonosporaceae bacterium]|nr:benzoate transporter [Micromonosporaceae bacterium]
MTTTKGTAAAQATLALGLLSAGALAGCTVGESQTPHVRSAAVRLVAFDSCGEAIKDLRAAARPYVGPHGFAFGHARGNIADGADSAEAARGAGAPGAADKAAPGAADTAPDHSTTNVHEKGVDEPDLVKTDGRRIVTVADGTLRVVDVAARRQTGALQLSEDRERGHGGYGVHLLMHGDRALVVTQGRPHHDLPEAEESPTVAPVTTQVLLIDLSGAPDVVSRMTLDGEYVDARAVGGVVRLVTSSAPRVPFKRPEAATSPARAQRENLATLNSSKIEDWLPRYEIDDGTSVTRGQVGCAQMSRPVLYSGTSMLTVMTLEMEAELSGKQAVSIAADGRTVYGAGQSLYVANDQSQVRPFDDSGRPPRPSQPRTEIYKFDTSRAGAPRHTGSGSVPGWLLNQYSMSEHEGYLRIATTAGQPGDAVEDRAGREPRSESAVYVLAHRNQRLVPVGSVGGLGKDERIYSVRFVGPIGYVVTFRQVDPLYVIDLRDPRRPKVTGELKITGYSAYLHPAAAGQLIGVGQEASTEGRTTGTQVSLFDVSDPATPRRLAQHHVKFGRSEAEFDPHAFLYWPKTGLLVIPLTTYQVDAQGQPGAGALVLKLSGSTFTKIGTVSHDGEHYQGGMVRRSLIIGDELWTVSMSGLKASDASTLHERTWIPFT